MGNWWADKVGTARPTPQQRPYDPAPRQQSYQAPPPVGTPQQVAQPPQAPQQPSSPGDPNGHINNLWGWQGNPNGGLGESMTTGRCPNCNSDRFFSRKTSGGVTTSAGVVYPSPECFECGYPRIQGTLAASAPMQGELSARQSAAPAPLGSLESLRQ